MRNLIIVLVAVIILTPQLEGFNLPIRLEDIIILLSLLLILVSTRFKLFFDKNFKNIIAVFLIFICINFLSLSYAVFQGYQSNIRDYNTLLLYVKSIVFLISGYLIRQRLTKISHNRIVIYFTTPILVSSILALIQYYDIAGLRNLAYSFYDDGSYKLSRAIGAMGNPNYAAYYHGLAFLLLLSLNITSSRFRIIKPLLLTLTFVSVILTFSRTGLIAVLMAGTFYLVINRKIGVLITGMLAFYLTILIYLDQLIKGTRFEIILSDQNSSVTDFGGRSDLIWSMRIEQFFLHPFIGSGPSKNTASNTIFGSTIYDNTYILLLVTCGTLGFISYLYIIIKVIIEDLSTPHKYLSYKNEKIKIISTICVYTLLFFFTVDLIWNIKFVSYFYLLIGFYMSHIYYEKIKYQHNKIANI